MYIRDRSVSTGSVTDAGNFSPGDDNTLIYVWADQISVHIYLLYDRNARCFSFYSWNITFPLPVYT